MSLSWERRERAIGKPSIVCDASASFPIPIQRCFEIEVVSPLDERRSAETAGDPCFHPPS